MKIALLATAFSLLIPFQTGNALATFSDVAEDFRAKSEIEFLNNQGVIFGFQAVLLSQIIQSQEHR